MHVCPRQPLSTLPEGSNCPPPSGPCRVQRGRRPRLTRCGSAPRPAAPKGPGDELRRQGTEGGDPVETRAALIPSRLPSRHISRPRPHQLRVSLISTPHACFGLEIKTVIFAPNN